MMPLTATAATAAPMDDVNANTVRVHTDATFHGATRTAARHAPITIDPAMYHTFRVSVASTKGAQTNSKVNASDVTAMIWDASRTETPAWTRLLPNARAITPIGHAVHAWRKKNENGGADRFML